MFGGDALGILHRHLVAGEGNDLRAERDVLFVERGALERSRSRNCRHGGRICRVGRSDDRPGAGWRRRAPLAALDSYRNSSRALGASSSSLESSRKSATFGGSPVIIPLTIWKSTRGAGRSLLE